MKKLLAIVLVGVMMMTLFTGCSDENVRDNSGNEDNNVSSEDANSQNNSDDNGDMSEGEDPDQIIMTYLTTGKTPADMEKVQAAVNDISREAINVEVEFKPLSIPETFSQYSLWISSGEQVDLMMSAFQGVANFANNGSIEPLNDLIDAHAPKIKELMAEYPITDGGEVKGEIFGIRPLEADYGYQGSLLMRKREMDSAGLEVKDRYSLEDFTEVFAAIKEANPDVYPYGVIGSDLATGPIFNFYNITDMLGNTPQSGVLMGTESTEIVNLFETEEYYDYLKLVRSWNEAGYIMPDAATTGSLKQELILNDIVSSIAIYNSPGMVVDVEKTYNTEFVALTTTDIFYPSTAPSSNTYWAVPITSGNPEAAIKFLNLLYEDHELSNLILWGIEGEHYVKTDQDGIITFPDGIDGNNSGYYNQLGLYGDRRFEYAWSAETTPEVREAFTEKAMENQTKAAGYSYDSSNMTNQLVAIDSVLSQYLPTLETGSVDVDSIYDTFITELKNAGIDEVIADNQAQFDAWLANQ